MSIAELDTLGASGDEQRRLAAARAATAAAGQSHGGLEQLVTLVARLLGYEHVSINLLHDTFQVTVAATTTDAGEVTPREQSICGHTILTPDTPTIIPDATQDPRFRDNPHVVAGLRAYLGVPLVTAGGCAIGALCVTDTVPRTPSPDEVETLQTMAVAVATELERSGTLIAIAEVTAALACANELADVHARIFDGVISAVGADGVVLAVREGERLEVAASSEPLPELVTVPVGPGTVSGRVCASGRPEFYVDGPEVPAISRALTQRVGGKATAVFPVGPAGPDGAAGVLIAWWRSPLTALAPCAQRTLTMLADQAAVAIERASLLERLELLSRTDALTGLANRRMLDEVLTREVARAARTGDPLAVAMIDLDHFKAYNDSFGHQSGDLLLRRASQAWVASVRRTDLVARYGGEEFVLVLPSCDQESAMRLIERVRVSVPDGQTCSIGAAMWDGVETPTALVGRSDRALYSAKRAGRDQLVFAPRVRAR